MARSSAIDDDSDSELRSTSRAQTRPTSAGSLGLPAAPRRSTSTSARTRPCVAVPTEPHHHRRASSVVFHETPTMPELDELADVHTLAVLSNYTYTRDPATLPGDFAPSTALMRTLQEEQGLPVIDGDPKYQEAGNDPKLFGTAIDESSGLVATVTASPAARQVVLAFGGTSAGPAANESAYRLVRNFKISWQQWKANFMAGIGLTPHSYQQAAKLADGLGRILETDLRWKGYTLAITGHSKGGGEASFAALMMARPALATVFSPAPLSERLLNQAPDANVERAEELINSYSVKGDPVPSLGKPTHLYNRLLNPLGLGPWSVGTAYTIPVEPARSLREGLHNLSRVVLHGSFQEKLESGMARLKAAAEKSGLKSTN